MQTDEIFEELKDKSFKGAKTVSEIPKLAAFQKSLLERQQLIPLDRDVADWLTQQDEVVRAHVNEMIRHMMAVASH